jgi:hypothetical protein
LPAWRPLTRRDGSTVRPERLRFTPDGITPGTPRWRTRPSRSSGRTATTRSAK